MTVGTGCDVHLQASMGTAASNIVQRGSMRPNRAHATSIKQRMALHISASPTLCSRAQRAMHPTVCKYAHAPVRTQEAQAMQPQQRCAACQALQSRRPRQGDRFAQGSRQVAACARRGNTKQVRHSRAGASTPPQSWSAVDQDKASHAGVTLFAFQ